MSTEENIVALLGFMHNTISTIKKKSGKAISESSIVTCGNCAKSGFMHIIPCT